MALTFQPVTLDTDMPDREAMLVFSEGGLLAVLTRLSDIHGALGGRWYVEAAFRDMTERRPQPFESLAAFEAWQAQAG